jgi:dipeptidyl aminopeptidase/acylaminoacyl peptidase
MPGLSSCKQYFIIVSAILSLFAALSHAETPCDPNRPIAIKNWLQTEPQPQALPVFNDVKNFAGKKFQLKDLLDFEQIDLRDIWPAHKDDSQFPPLKWQLAPTDPNGLVAYPVSDDEKAEVAYLAAYLHVNRWAKTKLQIHSSHLLKAYLDGSEITTKKKSDKQKKDKPPKPGKTEKEITLETGTHLLIIKALRDPENSAPWNIRATLQLNKDFTEDDIEISTSPEHKMNFKRLLFSNSISSVSISPDGDIVAVGLRRRLSDDKTRSSLQLYRTKDAHLLRTYSAPMKISTIKWAPTGRKFSYTSTEDKTTTLWIADLDTGESTPLLENVKDMAGHTWSPDASFIIYTVTEKAKKDKDKGLKLLKGMQDRLPGYRDRTFMYMVNVTNRKKQRLTAGLLSTSLNDISGDGRKLLFTRSEPDYTRRPYSKTEFFILDLDDFKADSLFKSNFSGRGRFSPDGKKLLITAGPEMFGDIGTNVPDGMIPNDYDTQAYIYDLQTKNVDPITKFFDPEISSAVWSKTQNCIYLKAVNKSYVALYRYDLAKKTFEHIDTGVEAIGRLNIADNQPIAVYTGSSANLPTKAYIIDLETGESRVLLDASKDDFKNVTLGKVQPWSFTNQRNTEIQGRIYYPPDFDSQKKYPCIVYYYGGTSPTTRYFGGSYPKNLYAAHGYVVYILQPSGATGFGQAFSALHVNDWGAIVADEIIEGVKKFRDAHPFIDPKRIGCVGASYGGFMTMLLQTRTDIFAAAVSHAGISSISSYWGEGYWGYAYSAVAAADSFPWTRSDIFIDQSPLFNADKINTPLLLLHGTKDTNVPPGESIQMYTALKLLGRDVELIEIKGENHGVSDHKKRLLWMKTTLAWFDRYLKDQPHWWDDLYEKK